VDPNALIPFIKSTKNIFETMLQLSVEVGTPELKEPSAPSQDVSGIIAFSGDFDGSVILSFPETTAHRVVNLFTGMDLSGSPEDLSDAVGELVNMIAGGAKAQFDGQKISISCPSVVLGRDHVVHGAKDVARVCIPCTCDCGEFNVEVAIREMAGAKPAAASAAQNAG
jgi:chemotaxis protein CheX